MATERLTAANPDQPYLQQLAVHVGLTLVYTPVYFIIFGWFGIVFGASLLYPRFGVISAYTYPALAWVALYASQIRAFEDLTPEEELPEYSTFTEILLVAWLYGYMHAMLLAGVGAGIVTTNQFGLSVGIVVAACIPVGDIYLNRNHQLGIGYATSGVVIWLSETLVDKTQQLFGGLFGHLINKIQQLFGGLFGRLVDLVYRFAARTTLPVLSPRLRF